MNKILVQIFIALFLVTAISAKHISDKDVYTAALNWIEQNESFLHYGKYASSDQRFTVKKITPIMDNAENILMYVAELGSVGFVLFSTDDKLKPVIGYSSEVNFNFQKYKEDYFINAIISNLNENLQKIKNSSKSTIQYSNNASSWKALIEGHSAINKVKEVNEIYGPFLNSDWGQGYVNGYPVYNYYTPNRWPAGCVATATAQLLNYYKWPLRGVGKHGYYDNGEYLSADFGATNYDWGNTLDQYTDQQFNLDNQKAAGLLTYHCAVALEMDFEHNGSTASTTDVPAILHNYFRGSGHYKKESETGFWIEMKNNMLDERPAIISIKSTQHSVGHAAVVDGYFDANDYYHVNPGWYGDYTGWYDISDSWDMGSYDIVVGAAKGIVPSPMINDIVINSESSFTLSWSTSRHQKAEYYELQEARTSTGSWTTLSNTITDTTYLIENADQSAYYYRVRARRDSIWWDYSEIKRVQLGEKRQIVFQINMTYRELKEGESVVIRGNVPPLAGNVNSDPMIGPDSDNIYKLTLSFDYDYVGTTLLYRFFIASADTLIPESSNREYVITDNAVQTLQPVYFDNVVSVHKEQNDLPSEYVLEQNYPNPFGEAIPTEDPSTKIRYYIPDAGNGNYNYIQLKIYDILGREVATLVNKQQSPGTYEVYFSSGNYKNLVSGTYFYQLKAGNFIQTKKMVLLR